MRFNADELVRRLLDDVMENEVHRVCSYCEQEGGPVNVVGVKTHGICQRHWLEMAQQAGTPQEKIDRRLADQTKAFAPDTGFLRRSGA
jgi:hypothetical protein